MRIECNDKNQDVSQITIIVSVDGDKYGGAYLTRDELLGNMAYITFKDLSEFEECYHMLSMYRESLYNQCDFQSSLTPLFNIKDL